MGVPDEKTSFRQTVREGQLRLDEGADTWELLTKHLEDFINTWEETQTPPALADYLPESPALRRLALIELVKIDMEYRRQFGAEVKQLDDYLCEFPQIIDEDGIPADLIHEEFLIRKAAGEIVTPVEYFDRFPEQAEELRRLLPFQGSTIRGSLEAERRHSLLKSGDTIDDFELILQLGKGAFASVFLARQTSLQRLVALKVSPDQGREPQTLAQLDHPNIVRVFDQRRLSDRQLRLLYMQYVPGGTLEGVIDQTQFTPADQRRGAILIKAIEYELQRTGHFVALEEAAVRRLKNMQWAEVVCRLGVQLASALEYAHQKGVLHRDVKPANVLLAADGTAKLADFNISFSSQLDGATPAAYFGGSLAYMSPEQLEACHPSHDRQPEELDGRSDIYSLGVVLWELLFGERPFGDERLADSWKTTLNAMIQRRRAGIDDRQVSSRDRLYRLVGRILLRCMSPDPDKRFATGEQVARQLQLCLHPRAARLLERPNSGWRAVVLQLPLMSVLIAALLPNVMAGVFNFVYNDEAIVRSLAEGSKAAFASSVMAINAIAFPLGVVIAAILVWPAMRAIRDARRRRECYATTGLVRRSLMMGNHVAVIGIALWLIAGIAYPVSLSLLAGRLDAGVVLHFLASLVFSGLIAAAYPYFFITALSVRVFFPALLDHALPNEQEASALRKLAGQLSFYLLMAGTVPALGTMTLITSGLFANSQTKSALLVLSVLGVIGFGVAFAIYRALQRDINALIVAALSDRIDAGRDELASLG